MSFECVLACFDSSSLHDCYDLFFFFNDTATTEIYTLSLHDALPIWAREHGAFPQRYGPTPARLSPQAVLQHVAMGEGADRKSTRLNSSHLVISYAVFCLKKKKCDGRALAYRGRHRHLGCEWFPVSNH